MQLDTATVDDHTFAHRSLLVDGVMSVDFAAIFRSSMQKYDATGITTGSANRILLTNPTATALSTTDVTFYQSGVSSSASGLPTLAQWLLQSLMVQCLM